MSDIRAQQARDHHQLAIRNEQLAGFHRLHRNRLIRLLRAEDPARWTYAALAAVVGCSPELIAVVIKVGLPS